MMVATLVNTLPMDAKKTNRLMGLWKALEPRKVIAMNKQPSSDKVEQTLSTVTKSFRSAAVSSSGVILAVSFEVWATSSVARRVIVDEISESTARGAMLESVK